MKKRSSNIPVKLEMGGESLVSEINHLEPSLFRCILNRAIPLQSKINITLILPKSSSKKTSDQKISTEGIISKVDCIQNEKNEMEYQTEISFLELSSSQKKWIDDFIQKQC